MILHGKVAFVTGASRGIGRELAFALAERGCGLVLTALEADELAEVARDLGSSCPLRVEFHPADLTDRASLDSLVDFVRTRSEHPDILINNAGGGRFGRFDASNPVDVSRTLDLNVYAPTRLTAELLPLLRRRPEAKVVFISSGIARLPYPGLAVYGAAKGYLSSLSESLACELAGSDVSVLCFHPGFTRTEFMRSARMDMSRVPTFALSDPKKVARRIVRAIERDRVWTYSDVLTRIDTGVARVLPTRLRIRLFRNLF